MAIQVEHLTFTTQGLVILVPQSKSDQLGRGTEIAVPYAPDPEVCAVRAVRAWLQAADIHTGPLFRPFTRRGFATSAAQHDVDALTIMRQTRHHSEKMVHRYIEQGNIFKENPLNKMFKK